MAFRSPAIVQNENIQINREKAVDRSKADLPKPAKTRQKERKALRDLSNNGKPPVKNALKSGIRAPEAVKNASKSSFPTDEDIKKCREWAKEGIERAHFTGNDIQEMHEELMKKRVKKKVNKIMSAVHEQSRWSIFDLVFPVKETAEDIDVVKEMELEPEVSLPHVDRGRSRSSVELFDEVEIAELPFNDFIVDLKLKTFNDFIVDLKLKDL